MMTPMTDQPSASQVSDASLEASSLEEDAERLAHLARTATVLSGDDALERSVTRTVQEAQEDARFFKATEAQIAQLVSSLNAHVQARAASDAAQDDVLFQQIDDLRANVVDGRRATQERLAQKEQEVRTILSEYDYIARLLNGTGSATNKQFDVMAFPRGANTKTNVLQISGGAGTGKTLCLLAKLIQDTRPSRQLGLLAESPRRGLFVCFNTALRVHVQTLLAHIPEAAAQIEVVSYDQFVNQLVRANPTEGFEHLADFATTSRYPHASATPTGKFWELIYQKDIEAALAKVMARIAQSHPAQRSEYYLDPFLEENLLWMSEEIAWLESRYDSPQQAQGLYPQAARVGRGTLHRPSAEIRRIILEVWEAFRRILEQDQHYTMEQATKRLLADPDLPRYDAIAIDEVQDLSVASVRLLVRMRANEQSRVYICGDEHQKIYKRDFTWAELDDDVHGYTITLDENKRNSCAIEAFANRLLGQPCSKEEASDRVWVGKWSESQVLGLVRSIQSAHPEETAAIISADSFTWMSRARAERLLPMNPRDAGVLDPGLYIIGEMGGKGLEFDNVIVDVADSREADEATLRNILYVNCTRARKRLYLRYTGEPPALLTTHYPDFLSCHEGTEEA